MLDLGACRVATQYGNAVRAYHVERTLCDIVRGQRAVDSQVVAPAMRKYATGRDRDPVKLLGYAPQARGRGEDQELSGGAPVRTKGRDAAQGAHQQQGQEAGIPAQALMQSYLLWRLLGLSKSKCAERRGDSMLISSPSSALPLAATMDLDTTVRGFDLTHESAESVFRQVAGLASDDDWTFEFDSTEDIRETDDYPGIRVHPKALYPPMAVPLTIDVTTGDKITPAPIEYRYPLLFDEGSTPPHWRATLETLLAEEAGMIVS